MARIVFAALVTVCAVAAGPTACTGDEPCFALISQASWTQALSSGSVAPIGAASGFWDQYAGHWYSYLAEGAPYPAHTFIEAYPPDGELYQWPGGPSLGLLQAGGLVMSWGRPNQPSGSYSSAWFRMSDPQDLSNASVSVTVSAPQFDAFGSEVSAISLALMDQWSGGFRSWFWRVGPGTDIPWNVPKLVTINAGLQGLGACTPIASGYATNPDFDVTSCWLLLATENATWTGGPNPIPPPGRVLPSMWNYWQLAMVTPNIPEKPEEPTKFSQPPVEAEPAYPPRFIGWNEKSVTGEPPLLADDWLCMDARPVTGVHWWGSFLGWDQPYPPPMPKGFRFGIWTDVPAADGNPSHPGQMVWESYSEKYQWNFAGYDVDPRGLAPWESCFQFNCALDEEEWFHQDQQLGTYWLSISAEYDQPTEWPWGWKTRPHNVQDAAQRILQVDSGWPPHKLSNYASGEPVTWDGQGWDLAFELMAGEFAAPAYDLGDAPASLNNYGLPMIAYPAAGTPANFPTAFFSGPPYGPLHGGPTWAAWLGTGVSYESEADYGDDEDATNNIRPIAGAADLDAADDAITLPLTLPQCRWKTLPYSYGVGPQADPFSPMYLNVWFDWNRDGDWDDTMLCSSGDVPEWAVRNHEVYCDGGFPGVYTDVTPSFLCWHPEVSGAPQPIWMRMTLAEKPYVDQALPGYGGSGPADAYLYGETEDYFFTPIVPPQRFDFGDAPDPKYPTLLASDGARHDILEGFCLGPAVDAEPDARQTPGADGDFTDDGVRLLTPIIPGVYSWIEVTASAAGFLNGWIDYNCNGSWNDDGEIVFKGQALSAGVNKLCILVPRRGAIPGPAGARFRFSSARNLPPTGVADDGEVEDYIYTIEQPAKMQVAFSVDIGSDGEVSDPFGGFYDDERFDPGDLYMWKGDPLPWGGADGFRDDFDLFLRDFSGFDVYPDGGNWESSPVVPVGQEYNTGDYGPWFDMDGAEQVDVHLEQMLWSGQPLAAPIPKFESNCIHEARFLQVSFDDDRAQGWASSQPQYPGGDVPVLAPSPAGHVHGTTAARDEVVGLNLATGAPPLAVERTFPLFDEASIHPDLAPNPDAAPTPEGWQPDDDDVDALDVVQCPLCCPFLLFSADHEANANYWGAEIRAGDIYEVNSPVGHTRVVDCAMHLGLAPATDIDAFQFAFLRHPQMQGEYLALIFSVDDDDPLTPDDESGGLDPRMIYFSFFDGTSHPLLQSPLEDDVDAISVSPRLLGTTIGEAKMLPVGSTVALGEDIVTADFRSRAMKYYIEEQDRSSGICVVQWPSPDIGVGDMVSVVGEATFDDYYGLHVRARETINCGPTNRLVAPAMMNRSVGGGAFGQQPAICDDVKSAPPVYSHALNNVGSLVRTFGWVTEVWPDNWFWIDDGSNLIGGPYFHRGLAVSCEGEGDYWEPPVGSFVAITGVVEAVMVDGASGPVWSRMLLYGGKADVEVLVP